MGVRAVIDKWRRIRNLAGDRVTFRLLVRLAASRYQYPGLYLLRKALGRTPLAASARLHLRREAKALQFQIRPGDEGDVASLFENFVELDQDCLRHVPQGLMIDAGAHIGSFSLLFHSFYPSRTIHALEPDAANAEVLRQNFAANAIPGEVLECALWTSRAVLNFERGVSNAGFLSENASSGSTVSVQAIGLDDLVKGGEHVSFVKMDIEGAEKDVLPGAFTRLAAPCVVYVEIHEAGQTRPALQRQWENAGWKGSLIGRYGPHEVWWLENGEWQCLAASRFNAGRHCRFLQRS